MLMRKAKGWFTGYNSNLKGHEHGKTRYFVYNGGTPKYVATINQVASEGYKGMTLNSKSPRYTELAAANLIGNGGVSMSK